MILLKEVFISFSDDLSDDQKMTHDDFENTILSHGEPYIRIVDFKGLENIKRGYRVNFVQL